jgi:inosine-uridine nucleoside N-ribohydrolase
MRLRALLLLPLTSLAMDKIVFDTDCGYFGDDGSALVMVLRSPEKVQIAGITVVSGNVWAAESAGYVNDILKILGHSQLKPRIGAQMPLVHSPALAKRETDLEFQGAFSRPMKISQPDPQPSALDFLAGTIQANPGGITILALGPLTNIAMLLRLHPDLETKIKRIVLMGGNVHVPGNASKAAEFNFWFDPEAAQIVLRSRIPEKILFPLDICNRAVLTKALFDQVAAVKTPVTERYRKDFGLRYPGFLKNPAATGFLWDELAGAWLIDSQFVTKSETLHLDVETHFGGNYGATIPLDRKLAPDATPVRVMLDLDFPRLFALYKRLLTL